MAKKGLALSLIAGVGIAGASLLLQAIAAQPSLAQAGSGADLLKTPSQPDALNDLFNGRGESSTSGLFELMQRISNPAADPAAFRAQQRENLDSAAAEFRAKQQQLLRQQQGQPQAAPAPSSAGQQK